ncbi:MAG: hypothetical protein ACLTMP_05060 [Eggerthella lenta]
MMFSVVGLTRSARYVEPVSSYRMAWDGLFVAKTVHGEDVVSSPVATRAPRIVSGWLAAVVAEGEVTLARGERDEKCSESLIRLRFVGRGGAADFTRR